jgi:hypothetical protein
MPSKSKPADTAAMISDDAIRQRAYYLWEADGRPEGTGDHYWHRAHTEAHEAMIAETATRTAMATKGANPAEMPPEVKASNRAAKAKVKAKVAEEPKAKPAKKPKAVEVKAPKKAPKPRGAVPKPI